MKTRKRFLSLLLCGAMLFSLCPQTALAGSMEAGADSPSGGFETEAAGSPSGGFAAEDPDTLTGAQEESFHALENSTTAPEGTARDEDSIIKAELDGYMCTEEFIEKYLPPALTLTNSNGNTTEVSVEWEIEASTYENYIPSTGIYHFKAIKPENLPDGYTWVTTRRQVKVTQSMVQISLGISDWTYDGDSQTINTTINGKKYEISFCPEGTEGIKICQDPNLFGFIYLPKEVMEQYRNTNENGTGYRLNITITGENAENAFPVLDSVYGYTYEEEYKNSETSSYTITPESYLIDAKPGRSVFALLARIDTYGAICINFKYSKSNLLSFDSNGSHAFTLNGAAGDDRNYKMSFVYTAETAGASQTSVSGLNKVFFDVTPPDDSRAWAVMVIPDNYVQTGDTADSGVSIDTDWGRESPINFSDGHRYMTNSLFRNSEDHFAATYLSKDMTAVISEIKLQTAQTEAVEAELNGKAELSVTADYQYEKLFGMTDVTYQWYQCDGPDGSNPKKINGATESAYNPPTSTAGTYYYYAEAGFEQFAESNSYQDMNGNTFQDYDSFGWASDTKTKSDVMTLVVGEQSSVEVEDPDPGTDDGSFVYGGEIAFLRFVVTTGDNTPAQSAGTITISLVKEDGPDVVIETIEGAELGKTLVFRYDTSKKGLKIGVNTIRIAYASNDEEIAGSSTELNITLKPKEVQAEVKDAKITKEYDGTAAAAVTLGFAENEILAGDEVTVTAPDAVYDSPDVGDNKPVHLGDLKLGGKDAEWYTVKAPENVTGSITPVNTGGTLPTYGDRTLISGDVSLSGSGIHRDARLTVSEWQLHEHTGGGESCAVCERLAQWQELGRILSLYDVSLSRDFRGDVTLSFPVPEEFEGQSLSVVQCLYGKLENQDIIAADGKVQITVDSLSPFAILEKQDLADCTVKVNGDTVTVTDQGMEVPSDEYTVTRTADTLTVTASEDSAFYTGSRTVSLLPGSTSLTVTGRTTSTVSLSWDKVEEAEGYTIWFRSEYDDTLSRHIIWGGDTTSWTHKGLQPGTKYFYKIRSWVTDENGKYVFSDLSEARTQRGTTKPEAAKITGVTVTGGKIKVRLAGEAAGAERYSMCYGDSRGSFRENDFRVGIRTSYTTRTLTPEFAKGTYYVCVKSYRDLGNNKRVYGEWSNTFRAVIE